MLPAQRHTAGMMSRLPDGPELAVVLGARSAAVVDDVVTTVAARLRERGAVDVDPVALRGSVEDNITLLLHLLANPGEVETALPPHRTVSHVRAFAQTGMPLHDVVEAYLLGERTWIRACIADLTDVADDASSAFSLVLRLLDLDRVFVEHHLLLLTAQYEQERARWAGHDENVRSEALAAVLSGELVDIHASEAALGYRLRRRHIAAIVSVAPSAPGDAVPTRVDRAIPALCSAVGAVGAPLVMSRSRSVRWVWIPVGDATPDVEAMSLTPSVDAGLCVAVGEAAPGRDGFARSHRQALAAHTVGKHTTAQADRALVVPYREVGAIAFLAADLEQARDWVTQTLGRLAADAPRERDLRATVEAYLRSGRNVSAAARELRCHRNTVHYRLSVAEGLLGHPVVDHPSDLQLALTAARWLGTVVLDSRVAAPGR